MARKKKEEKKEIEEIEIKEVSKEEDNKSPNKVAWIIGIIVGILVVAGVSLLLLMPKFTKVPDIKVPDVTNMTVLDAENKLESAGFIVNTVVEEVYSDTIEEGKIVKTVPAVNRTIKKGSSITLYQSKGTEKIKIEDYTDKNIYEIKAKLELLGLSVTIESKNVENVEEYADKEDLVIDQNPKSGELYKNDQIILYYPNIVVYPDLTTYTLEEVQEFAEKYELDLIVEEVETETVEEGTIISQNRRKDTLIVRGADLTVKIAVKPKEEVIVPEDTPEEGEVVEEGE